MASCGWRSCTYKDDHFLIKQCFLQRNIHSEDVPSIALVERETATSWWHPTPTSLMDSSHRWKESLFQYWYLSVFKKVIISTDNWPLHFIIKRWWKAMDGLMQLFNIQPKVVKALSGAFFSEIKRTERWIDIADYLTVIAVRFLDGPWPGVETMPRLRGIWNLKMTWPLIDGISDGGEAYYVLEASPNQAASPPKKRDQTWNKGEPEILHSANVAGITDGFPDHLPSKAWLPDASSDGTVNYLPKAPKGDETYDNIYICLLRPIAWPALW